MHYSFKTNKLMLQSKRSSARLPLNTAMTVQIPEAFSTKQPVVNVMFG